MKLQLTSNLSNLDEWILNNEPQSNLVYINKFREELLFVEHTLPKLFLKHYFFVSIIGEHYSKSIKLPVIQIEISDLNLVIILRFNFHDWCISIESQIPIECDFLNSNLNNQGYFEGFDENRMYGTYSKNNNRYFSICLSDKYEVYMFVAALMNFLNKAYKK